MPRLFIDEFGASSNMTRHYARGPVGKRIVCRTPHGHWKMLSTIAAMDCQGILSAGTFDHAVDEETFVSFVEQCLVPRRFRIGSPFDTYSWATI